LITKISKQAKNFFRQQRNENHHLTNNISTRKQRETTHDSAKDSEKYALSFYEKNYSK